MKQISISNNNILIEKITRLPSEDSVLKVSDLINMGMIRQETMEHTEDCLPKQHSQSM
jgi:hypothetical protein